METLNRKIAGLPVKVWLLVIVAAIGVGLYLRRRAAMSTPDQTGYDTGTAGDYYPEPISGTVGGGSGGGGVGQSPQDLTPITDAISKVGTDVISAIASIPIPATEPAPPLPAAAPPPTAPPMLASIPPPSPVAAPGPSAPPPATMPTPPPAPAGPVPGASFTWVFNATHGLPAKSVWYMQDKSLFLQHLGARGLGYAQWRSNHASAACRVFGDCS